MLKIHFASELTHLLYKPWKNDSPVRYPLRRRASIKDIVEALGIPHTEIGQILVNGRESGFGYIPRVTDRVKIEATSPQYPVTVPCLLRPEPLPEVRFLVDSTVLALARLLRMAGFDTDPPPETGSKRAIAIQAAQDRRILLSRNRELLKVKEAIFGHLLRSPHPKEQFKELSQLYELTVPQSPFSRCLECNHLLEPVAKATICDRLQPLTRKYYHSFKHCSECDRIYWKGSHWEAMARALESLSDP